MAIVTLLAGLVLLVLAGDALVRGAVAAARRLRIPPIIIGLTIVAFGTSAPEFIVSLEAALAGAPGLAIGNVVGSNLANVLMVLGVPALIAPILLSGDGIRRSSIFMIAVSVVLAVLAFDTTITRIDGAVLFLLLCGYLGYSGYVANKHRGAQVATAELNEINSTPLSAPQIGLLLIFGIAGLGFGGKMTTDGALGVAEMLGVADSAVGLTIVALGTSLPELATSITAALRRETGVVIGNVIGSNIFNILGILGLTAIITPLHVDRSIMTFDIWVMLAASIILVPIAFLTRRVNRYEGAVMVVAYVAYTAVVFHNGMAI